ncbi:MAG: SWIM zinc finger family protein [Saprospiraceae bacterium]
MEKTANKTEIPPRATLLAQPGFFPQRFVFEKIIFAEITANEKVAHGVAVDLETRSLYCTCPFRPKPCIHALALNALFDRESEAIFTTSNELPDWVNALLNGLPASQISSGKSAGAKAVAKAKTRFERLERAANGMEDLEAWLLDTARRGLATVVSEDSKWWEGIASRMADASMTGLSRTLRLLGQISPAAPDWAERVAGVFADCYLAVRAFRKRETLPEPLLFDLQNFVGINTKKEEVLAFGERLQDVWAVIGQIEEPLEDKLSVRRTWLLGGKTGRYALLLDYAFGTEGFSPGFEPGTIHRGALAFYPSAFPQRTLVVDDFFVVPKKVEKLPGFTDFEDFMFAYAAAVASQPWLQIFPAAFGAVVPAIENGRFFLVDKNEKMLPLDVSEGIAWQLVALSGGAPIGLFGEWARGTLRPLSVTVEGRFVSDFYTRITII